MKKKLIIVVICLVTICAVLGLNDRLDYDGLADASAIVKAETKTIYEDFYAIQIFTTLVGFYEPDTYTSIELNSYAEGEYTINVRALVPLADGGTEPYVGAWTFEDYHTAKQITELLEPITRPWTVPDADGFFETTLLALDSIAFVLSLVFVVIMFVLMVLIDVAGIAASLVEAVFYLLGF